MFSYHIFSTPNINQFRQYEYMCTICYNIFFSSKLIGYLLILICLCVSNLPHSHIPKRKLVFIVSSYEFIKLCEFEIETNILKLKALTMNDFIYLPGCFKLYKG